MHSLLVSAVASAIFSRISFVSAAVVDAGAVTTVAVEAPLHDPNRAAGNGCDPVGCVGDLTRVSG